MRRDGDRLVEHLAGARRDVLICAPFIKAHALDRLLGILDSDISVRIVTRWLPKEVAVGVSDLEIYDRVISRPNTSLSLLDRLHAKVYGADGVYLIGSANVTGPALGWSSNPNLELLTLASASDDALVACLAQLNEARPATLAERDRIRGLADAAAVSAIALVEDAEPDGAPYLWLPRLAAPSRLYQAYVPATRARLIDSVREAALEDLSALGIPEGLPEVQFNAAVAAAFRAMPAIQRLLAAAADDLRDSDGADIISQLPVGDDLQPDQRWLAVREWMTTFLGDQYEIAPASFVVRLRPRAAR